MTNFIRVAALAIVFQVLLILSASTASNAWAAPFDAENKKALVFFAMKPHMNGKDVIVYMNRVDTEKRQINLRKGDFVLIGDGSPLFGPHTQEYKISDDKKVMFQPKKLKPGTYMLLWGNAFLQGGKEGQFGCFDQNSKLFTVEAGKIYFTSLPDGRAMKDEGKTDWLLDPKFSDEDLRSTYNNYISQNPKKVGDASVSILPFKRTRYKTKKVAGKCSGLKPSNYEVLESALN